MCVDESEQMSHANAAALEIVPNQPQNKVVQVTILTVPLLEFVIMVLDGAKQKVTDKRLAEIAERARDFNPNQKEDFHE